MSPPCKCGHPSTHHNLEDRLWRDDCGLTSCRVIGCPCFQYERGDDAMSEPTMTRERWRVIEALSQQTCDCPEPVVHALCNYCNELPDAFDEVVKELAWANRAYSIMCDEEARLNADLAQLRAVVEAARKVMDCDMRLFTDDGPEGDKCLAAMDALYDALKALTPPAAAPTAATDTCGQLPGTVQPVKVGPVEGAAPTRQQYRTPDYSGGAAPTPVEKCAKDFGFGWTCAQTRGHEGPCKWGEHSAAPTETPA